MKEWSDGAVYFTFLVVLASIILLVCQLPTILPVMSDDKYFVDKYGNIHGDNCPYKSIPWFSKKYSKYDILIKKDQEICRECLLYEEDKLWELHYINLELRKKYLRINGATEDYIEKEMQEYQ